MNTFFTCLSANSCKSLYYLRTLFSRNLAGYTRQILPVILLTAAASMGYTQEKTPGSEKYVKGHLRDHSGQNITRIVVPEKPPVGFRAPVVGLSRNATVLSPVPAYKWSFGCSPTAAAMAAAFYDRTNFPEIYTGPSNGV